MEADRLLSLREVADKLGVPVATMYAWRHRGYGPPGYRLGKHVRYDPDAVEAWLEGQRDPAPA